MVHGNLPPGSLSCSFFSIGKIPRGGLLLGSPSVNNMMCCKRPRAEPALSNSMPLFRPAHKLVMPEGCSCSSCRCVESLPPPSMAVRSKTVSALLENATSASRSLSARFMMMVFRECLTTSSTERPWPEVSPLSVLSIASSPMEPETSTMQQMSEGVRPVPGGGAKRTMTGTPPPWSPSATRSAPGDTLRPTTSCVLLIVIEQAGLEGDRAEGLKKCSARAAQNI
mmetsp:Transcript_27846/g.86703  ORF Transcript_27846/g.86703 Transcript_27846/m.86703 type:complete len:225 (+) Transcript_27846:1523-2197(+)